MTRLAADENFNNNIVRGVLRREPTLDFVRVQDVGLSGKDDDCVLRWAATQERVLLTHDVATLVQCALERVGTGEPMPGVFVVPPTAALARVIEEILLIAECAQPGEWEGQIRYLPLR